MPDTGGRWRHVSLAAALVFVTLALTGEELTRAFAPQLLAVSRLGFSVLGAGLLSLTLQAEDLRRAGGRLGLAVAVALPWAYAAVLAMGRGEFAAMQRDVFGLLSVLAVALLPALVNMNGLRLATVLLVGGSLLLALVDPRWVLTGGRDLLPGLYAGRAFGLLGHPNALGQVAAMTVLLAGAASSPRWRWSLLIVGTTGVFAAASQTALLALAAGAAVGGGHAVFRKVASKEGRLALLAVLIGAAPMAILAWRAGFLDAFVPDPESTNYTLTGRTDLWRSLLATERPFTGLGAEGLAELISSTTYVGSTHNAWIDVFLINGWAGVVTWAIAVLAIASLVRRSGSSLALAALVFFLLECVTESAPVRPGLFPMYLALLLSLASPRATSAPGDCAHAGDRIVHAGSRRG